MHRGNMFESNRAVAAALRHSSSCSGDAGCASGGGEGEGIESSVEGVEGVGRGEWDGEGEVEEVFACLCSSSRCTSRTAERDMLRSSKKPGGLRLGSGGEHAHGESAWLPLTLPLSWRAGCSGPSSELTS